MSIFDLGYWPGAEGRARLSRLYGSNETRLDAEASRYWELSENFARLYGSAEEPRFFSSPGRSEIAGNHTDHQYGKVIAAAVDLDAIAAVTPRNDMRVILHSQGYPRYSDISLTDLTVHEEEKDTSTALIRGVAAGLRERGYQIGGFSCYTMSEVPSGSGLSSSAAFEILLITIFDHLYNSGTIPPLVRAQIGQYAENVYFGKPSGLLDQSGCAVGGFAALDFAGGGTPKMEQIQVDFTAEGYNLVITQTGGSHANLTHEYAAIPEEMRQIASAFGQEVLSEVNPADFYQRIPELRSLAGDRAVLRALHFFTEQDRVTRQELALREKEIDVFLALVNESGLSSELWLQNVTPPGETKQQEVALALALSRKFLSGRKGAVRVHGGGFGGTIQAYISLEDTKAYTEVLDAVYGVGSAQIVQIRPFGGVEVN